MKLYKNIKIGLFLSISAIILNNQSYTIQNNNEPDPMVETSDVQDLPLHNIIKNQSYTTQEKLQLIQALLDEKVIDINAKDIDGKTALNIITFYKGDPLLAQLLIKYGAKVNEPDRFNQMPLHNAILYDEIEIARMLLAKSADIRFKNDEGVTPIDLARSPDTIKLFGLE